MDIEKEEERLWDQIGTENNVLYGTDIECLCYLEELSGGILEDLGHFLLQETILVSKEPVF